MPRGLRSAINFSKPTLGISVAGNILSVVEGSCNDALATSRQIQPLPGGLCCLLCSRDVPASRCIGSLHLREKALRCLARVQAVLPKNLHCLGVLRNGSLDL